METITAIIPTKNEEKNIETCIKSLSWCNEVIVMDMGTDNTSQIAEKLGAKVFKIESSSAKAGDFVAVQKNINWAIDHAKSDWILRIDADEEVTPELQNEIVSILKNPEKFVAYGVPRRQYFWGGFLKGGDWAYDRLVRLFRRDKARYESLVNVHEQFKVDGEISTLKFPLNHYSHRTLADARRKFQEYTNVQVNDMHESKSQAVFNLFFQPPYVFLRWMIWHKGIIDGLRGVVAGAYRGWYEYLLYSKYLKKVSKK
jgi:glycosyltransferase involved in cell wall biosynthesis